MRASARIWTAAATLSLVLVAGCGSDGGTASEATTPTVTGQAQTSTASPVQSSPATATTPPAPTSPAGVTTSGSVISIVVTVMDGRPSPDLGRVEVPAGQTVRLTVTSSIDDEVHVHGIEEELTLQAGLPGTLEFVAEPAGLYEVETHEGSPVLLFQLLVR